MTAVKAAKRTPKPKPPASFPTIGDLLDHHGLLAAVKASREAVEAAQRPVVLTEDARAAFLGILARARAAADAAKADVAAAEKEGQRHVNTPRPLS